MDTTINVVLLFLGLGGALTAFIGDTIQKSPDTTHRRITAIGWVSIILLLAAFGLGVFKQVRTHRNETRMAKKASAAAKAQQRAEAELQAVTKSLSAATDRLATSQQQLREATRDISMDQDEGYIDLRGYASLMARSARTGEQLAVYPGDEFQYYSFCPSGGYYKATPTEGLALLVEDRLYPLNERSGNVRIAGAVGRRLLATIINPVRERCHLKFVIRSTPRNRASSAITR
jgi:hypothetical protein